MWVWLVGLLNLSNERNAFFVAFSHDFTFSNEKHMLNLVSYEREILGNNYK